jgi:hypothetical protein
MLTDIFANRYSSRVLWEAYTEVESKLLVQCFRIVAEQLIPYWVDGKESETAKAKWMSLHSRLGMELGKEELAPRYYSYQDNWMGKPYTHSGVWTYDKICKDFVCARYTGDVPPDRFMKERISFVELAFRLREEELLALNLNLPKMIEAVEKQDFLSPPRGLRIPGSRVEAIKATNASLNGAFKASVKELNERFRQAGKDLNYHNGFIQVATDLLVEELIERPFWEIVADPLWENIDIDMKEALDRRDANDRDPAFYAARALESAIKIISDQRGWTHGNEKGAHNYIDNLSSKVNGAFIKEWERDALKTFFTTIRNPISHGPGSAEMPQLTLEQTNWAIETCMSWIKSLVQRLQRNGDK